MHNSDPEPASRTGRRQGRPSKPLLSRQRIIDAAVSVIRHSGPGALTVTRLAAELDVTPPALYNHASGKPEILRWVEDYLMARITIGDFSDGDWLGAMRTWAYSYREVMHEYSALIPTIATTPVTGAPLTIAMYEHIAAGLTASGWPEQAIVPVIVAVESFVYGSAYDVVAPDSIFDVDASERASAPAFAAAVEAHHQLTRSEGRRANEVFDTGLDALLTALARRYGVADAPHGTRS